MMNRKTAVVSLLAFLGAIGLGRVFLNNPDCRETPIAAQGASVAVAPAVAMQVKADDTAAEAERKKKEEKLERFIKEHSIDQELKTFEGGVENQNLALGHTIFSQYLEGTFHRTTVGFGETVRWMPHACEILKGNDIVAMVASARPVKGTLDKTNPNGEFIYRETYPATDERMYIKKQGGIEHDIILKQPPVGVEATHSLSYSGYLTLGSGLTLWDGDTKITGQYRTSNGLMIKNAFKNTAFYLRPPVAWDAKISHSDGTLDMDKLARPEFVGCYQKCEYLVDFDDSGIKLSVLTPGSWLVDAKRAYPVIIDPNLGQFQLADGRPAIYVGSVASSTYLPVHNGGTPLPIEETCDLNGFTKPDNGYGHIVMPFPFTYYGVLHPTGSFLFVHIDGWAGWIPPFRKYDPLNPNHSSCFDTDNTPIPTPGSTTNGGAASDDCFFPYWDDLQFSSFSDPDTKKLLSGIYYLVDGIAPSRKLVIEWYKMTYVADSSKTMSFNLILYECGSKIQFIIGTEGDTDRGFCSVGIEAPGGTVGIQYCWNGAEHGPPSQLRPGTNDPLPPITPNTSLLFQVDPISDITVTTEPVADVTSGVISGCTPLNVCFHATVKQRTLNCELIGGQAPLPPSFGFHWLFSDGPTQTGFLQGTSGSEAFTPDTCHLFTRPGIFAVQLLITDQFGNQQPYGGTLTVQVCDIPQVVLSVVPQGGSLPLVSSFETRFSIVSQVPGIPFTPGEPPQQAFTILPNTQGIPGAEYIIDQLGLNAEPGQLRREADFSGSAAPSEPVSGLYFNSNAQYTFDKPGIFRVTSIISATDLTSSKSTTGTNTAYVFVTTPNTDLQSSIFITESKFNVNWNDKKAIGGAGSVTPNKLTPPNPNTDTIYYKGIINLPGMTQSDLFGRRVRVVVNGTRVLIDSLLDASGKATQGDAVTGTTGNFSINLPSGQFTCNGTTDLVYPLGLQPFAYSKNTVGAPQRFLVSSVRIEIEGLFPPPELEGPFLTYEYVSGSKKATGTYSLGKLTKFNGPLAGHPFGNPNLPGEIGRPGGAELMVSGGFLVTNATLDLKGNTVFANVSGILARAGGDSLRPGDRSDVVVSIGDSYREALNFTTTPGFKVSGKAPRQKFSFKRSKSQGQTGIASLQWVNGFGNFSIKTYGIPNEQVGLNPAAGVQLTKVGLQITDENGQTFSGESPFTVQQISTGKFSRSSK